MAASRYELIAKLASGGMGSVFVGRVRGPLGFSRLVAIKRAHPHMVDDPTFVKMLVDEAKLASRINHPHVVSTLDVEQVKETVEGKTKREIRLVMDYVEGLTLAQLAALAAERGTPLAPAVAVRIILDAGMGLQAAHELQDDAGLPLGIVHRDISPQNLLVGIDGMTRVSDFGIAKATMRPDNTTSGALKGKLGYMAPEYVQNSTLDARSDVFSLGVVLWEAVVGKKLFRGANEIDTLQLVARADVPKISVARPEVGDSLDDVAAAALARDPEQRFASSRAFINALETAARRSGLVSSHEEAAIIVRELAKDMLEERRQLVRDRVKELDAKVLSRSTTEGDLRSSVERAKGLLSESAPLLSSVPSFAKTIDSQPSADQDATFGSGVSASPELPSGFSKAPRALRRAWVWGLSLAAGVAAAVVVFSVAIKPPHNAELEASSAPGKSEPSTSQSVAAQAITVSPAAVSASARPSSSSPPVRVGPKNPAWPTPSAHRPTSEIPPNPYLKN